MKKVGIVADDIFSAHRIENRLYGRLTESPERLKYVYRKMNRLLQQTELYRAYHPTSCTLNKAEDVHSDFYLQQLIDGRKTDNPFWYCPETYIVSASLDVASLAANSAVLLADEIMSGTIDAAYAIIRPPGHHAEQGQAMGYCILNNAAIVARHLLKTWGLSKILILDFDAHHGNGTQQIFYNTNDVLVISIHEAHLFPKKSGDVNEAGDAGGLGYNINIPVYPSFGDEEYSYIFSVLLAPVIQQYQPEFVIVSAGYDAHIQDTFSNLKLTTEWFRYSTRMIKKWTETIGGNHLLYILEGGYHPEILADTIADTLEILTHPVAGDFSPVWSDRADTWARAVIFPELSRFWDFNLK